MSKKRALYQYERAWETADLMEEKALRRVISKIRGTIKLRRRIKIC